MSAPSENESTACALQIFLLKTRYARIHRIGRFVHLNPTQSPACHVSLARRTLTAHLKHSSSNSEYNISRLCRVCERCHGRGTQTVALLSTKQYPLTGLFNRGVTQPLYTCIPCVLHDVGCSYLQADLIVCRDRA